MQTRLADVRFALARTLWTTDRSQARELANLARDSYARARLGVLLEEVEDWLRKHA